MQWFRLHNKLLNDPVVQGLEDAEFKVYINLLLHASILNKDGNLGSIEDISFCLRISSDFAVQCIKTFIKKELVDSGNDYKIPQWNKKQYKKDKADYMPSGESLGDYNGYIYFISDDEISEIKIGYSKNPWARVNDFQTATTRKLSVVATVKTTEVSERTVHEVFEYCRIRGEWFSPDEKLVSTINSLKEKRIKSVNGLFSYVDNYVYSNVATTTDTDTDTEQNNKPSCQRKKFSDDDMKCAEYIFHLIQQINPESKEPNFDKWADTIRLMVDRDKRTHKEICEVFKWANNDDFWKTNILGPDKLRKQYDALKLKMNTKPKISQKYETLTAIANDDEFDF